MEKKNFFESMYKNANHDEFALFEKENEIKPVAPYQYCVLYRK
jgi:hypothetical protein